MTLADLKMGDFFFFLSEDHPRGRLFGKSLALRHVTGGRFHLSKMRDCALFRHARGAGWYASRSVRKVFPCKCCLDLAGREKARDCSCRLGEGNS